MGKIQKVYSNVLACPLCAGQGGSNMGKIQKVYSKECKEEAVRLAQTSGKPIAQIAREPGISDSSIHGWRKE